ncbi:MAG: hypothetical protein HY902_10015 [Deltaproteobacteria bacterium]|nr:hypothetical protein [Deltaproteobacteria bacterium]
MLQTVLVPARAVALLTAFALLASACTTVHAVKPTELTKLDGFVDRELSTAEAIKSLAEEPEYALVDESGRRHSFDSGTRLVLDTAVAGKSDRVEEKYRSVVVRDGVFSGKTAEDGENIQIPLANIEMAGVRRRSIGKTLLLVGGIATGLFLILVIAAVSNPNSGNSSSSSHGDLFD